MTDRFDTLDEAARAVRALTKGARATRGARSPAQALLHCAAAIELSITGYPVLKPAIVRATIGRLVLRRFLSRGEIHHNVDAGIPGVPEPPGDAEIEPAVERLLQAISSFQAATGKPADHFIYGPVTKEQYSRLHAMHIADHLSVIEP